MTAGHLRCSYQKGYETGYVAGLHDAIPELAEVERERDNIATLYDQLDERRGDLIAQVRTLEERLEAARYESGRLKGMLASLKGRLCATCRAL